MRNKSNIENCDFNRYKHVFVFTNWRISIKKLFVYFRSIHKHLTANWSRYPIRRRGKTRKMIDNNEPVFTVPLFHFHKILPNMNSQWPVSFQSGGKEKNDEEKSVSFDLRHLRITSGTSQRLTLYIKSLGNQKRWKIFNSFEITKV